MRGCQTVERHVVRGVRARSRESRTSRRYGKPPVRQAFQSANNRTALGNAVKLLGER
jgi:hypothetical protein